MMSFQIDLIRTTRLAGLAIICTSGSLPLVLAQQPGSPRMPRQSGGWIPVDKTSNQPNPSPVKTAYFQAQGSLSDNLPVLPAGNPSMPQFPGAGGVAGSVSPPIVPPEMIAPPQLPMPRDAQPSLAADRIATEQQNFNNQPNRSAQQQYSNEQPNHEPNYPNSSPNNGNPTRNAQPLIPQQQPNNSGPARLSSGELRSIQNGRQPSPVGMTSTAGSNNLNQTAAESNLTGRSPDGRLAAEGFTSGLPFVTPAPRGRYATSPYQPAVFNITENAGVPVPAQFVSSSTTQPQSYVAPQPVAVANLPATQAYAPQPAANSAPNYLTAQQAPLPQFRYPQPAMLTAYQQCNTPGPSVPSTGAVPGAYIPPTLPPNLTPNLYTPNNSGYTPFFSLGQENYNVQLGRGIIGQPTVYVPGQPIRNFMRYLSP